MAPRKLLGARIAIIDNDQETMMDSGDFADPVLRGERNLNAFARFWMDAVVIEKRQLFGVRGKPDFGEVVVVEGEMKFASRAEDFDGKGIKELVGEDDDRRFWRERSAIRAGGIISRWRF